MFQMVILPLIIAKLLITEEEISPIVKRATGVEEVLKGEKKMWIARDKDGELTLFSNKPHRCRVVMNLGCINGRIYRYNDFRLKYVS